jgi:hypothetical protein
VGKQGEDEGPVNCITGTQVEWEGGYRMCSSMAEVTDDENDACTSNGSEVQVQGCREKTRGLSAASPGCELSGREGRR